MLLGSQKFCKAGLTCWNCPEAGGSDTTIGQCSDVTPVDNTNNYQYYQPQQSGSDHFVPVAFKTSQNENSQFSLIVSGSAHSKSIYQLLTVAQLLILTILIQ